MEIKPAFVKKIDSTNILLILPKGNNAPMLFLEFISDISVKQNSPITCKVKEITEGKYRNDYFAIQLVNQSIRVVNKALKYINANL